MASYLEIARVSGQFGGSMVTPNADFATLRGAGFTGSLSDMRRQNLLALLSLTEPQGTNNDLELRYWRQIGGTGSIMDMRKVQTVRNIVDGPAPTSLANWASNDDTKWTRSFSGGIVSFDRKASADALITASISSTGLIGTPTLLVGSQWQRSVEVLSTVPVTVTFFAPGGYPTGQQIPANVWTTIRNNFIGTGVAANPQRFSLVAASDPGLGILTQLRHAMLVQAPSDRVVAYADGGSPGWTWEGTANASPSVGPATYI